MVGSRSSLPKGALKLSSLIDALANVCTEACINACEIVFAKWTISHRNLCIPTKPTSPNTSKYISHCSWDRKISGTTLNLHITTTSFLRLALNNHASFIGKMGVTREVIEEGTGTEKPQK